MPRIKRDILCGILACHLMSKIHLPAKKFPDGLTQHSKLTMNE